MHLHWKHISMHEVYTDIGHRAGQGGLNPMPCRTRYLSLVPRRLQLVLGCQDGPAVLHSPSPDPVSASAQPARLPPACTAVGSTPAQHQPATQGEVSAKEWSVTWPACFMPHAFSQHSCNTYMVLVRLTTKPAPLLSFPNHGEKHPLL